MSTKVSKRSPSVPSKKSRVREVPNFHKLHGQWKKKFETGLACKKKPSTVVHEFGLSQPGMKVEHPETKALNREDLEYGDENSEPFLLDPASLDSIVRKSGLSEKNLTGRATIASGLSVLKNRTNLEARPSDHGLAARRAKVKATKSDSKSGKVKSTSKSVKRKATSPPNAENMQATKDMKFESDDHALQSILSNRGVTPSQEPATTEPRRTTYSRVPNPRLTADHAALFTDYKSRLLSRLRADQGPPGSPQTASKEPASKGSFELIRNSIYVRRVRPSTAGVGGPASALKPAQRAQRVPATPRSASHTPSARANSQKKLLKWKDILSQDLVKKSLNFDDDNDSDGTSDKIKELSIKDGESTKQNSGQIIKDQESNVKNQGSSLSMVVTDEQQLKYIEEEEAKLQAEIAEIERKKQAAKQATNQEAATTQSTNEDAPDTQDTNQKPSRLPFGELTKSEIRHRSSRSSDSDSSAPPSPSSQKRDVFPVSPLAKDARCTPVSPFAVSHGIKSKKAPSEVVRERDLWSPRQRQRVSRGSRSPQGGQRWRATDGPRSPLFSHIMARGQRQADSDKENSTPSPVARRDIATQRDTTTAPRDNVAANNAVAPRDAVTASRDAVADEVLALQAEMDALSESFVDLDTSAVDDLYTQIQEVRDRQQRLLDVEKRLQERLHSRKRAKKRLDLAPEDENTVGKENADLTPVEDHEESTKPFTDHHKDIPNAPKAEARLPALPQLPEQPLSPLRAAALTMTVSSPTLAPRPIAPRPIMSAQSPGRPTYDLAALTPRRQPRVLDPLSPQQTVLSPAVLSPRRFVTMAGSAQLCPPASPMDLRSDPTTPLRKDLTLRGEPITPLALRSEPQSSPVDLSLPARLRTAPLPSVVSVTAQKYRDALLDDEVALYMCRLASPRQPSVDMRCPDPTAKLLEHGDDMHFIPLPRGLSPAVLCSPPSGGSAFFSYRFI